MLNEIPILSELVRLHQKLKLDYLYHALDHRYPNLGLGNDKNNKNTVDFLKKSKNRYRQFFEKLAALRREVRKSADPAENYSILKELYMISPSVHELWFFDSHFRIRIEAIIKGRLGLRTFLTARSKGNQPLSKAAITYLTKNCILLENQYASEIGEGLLDARPLKQIIPRARELSKMDLTFENQRNVLNSGVIEKIFSLVHALLKDVNYQPLTSDNLARKERWLYYAPCSVNEGPLFLPKKGTPLTAISSNVSLENPRQSLSEELHIRDYFDELRMSDYGGASQKLETWWEITDEKLRK